MPKPTNEERAMRMAKMFDSLENPQEKLVVAMSASMLGNITVKLVETAPEAPTTAAIVTMEPVLLAILKVSSTIHHEVSELKNHVAALTIKVAKLEGVEDA